ncbi:MAG TPA: LysM peptidoglycan-binding domain-containing protein [Candidatus Dormibacteraeota bacterium]|nr:LysM peptidoglycan-binding domain-containing protein [Candidatus Dormibacteraeota bacterium]
MSTRPRIAAAALGATAAVAVPTAVAASTYVVRPGDTLTAIAALHGTTVRALADANKLTDANLIRVGQLLRIPDSSLGLPGYTAGARDDDLYTVRPGEGLLAVARHWGVDPTALAQANGIGVHTPLLRGTTLRIPGRLARVNALLTTTAEELSVDARLVRAVAWMESGWQQNVVSPTGAVGLMQIEPYTGEWVGRYLAERPLDLQVARDNVVAGCLLLHHLLSIHAGDASAALAAYYQGDASIARHGLFADTRRYQSAIEALMKRD